MRGVLVHCMVLSQGLKERRNEGLFQDLLRALLLIRATNSPFPSKEHEPPPPDWLLSKINLENNAPYVDIHIESDHPKSSRYCLLIKPVQAAFELDPYYRGAEIRLFLSASMSPPLAAHS